MVRAPRRSLDETREHVLSVAADLFYWKGIRASGVDVIASAAGVAPTTLYRVFASKEDLVAAYVDRSAADYRARYSACVAAAGPDARSQVLAVFDLLIEETSPGVCRGCAFQLVLAETPEETPARQGAVAVKAWTRELFGSLTASFSPPVDDPSGLADQLMLIMEGVYGSAAADWSAPPDRPARPARSARGLVEYLIGSAL